MAEFTVIIIGFMLYGLKGVGIACLLIIIHLIWEALEMYHRR